MDTVQYLERAPLELLVVVILMLRLQSLRFLQGRFISALKPFLGLNRTRCSE